MANDEIKYYSIGEVSDLLDIKESTLRYWQKEFDELDPERTDTNRRIYTKKDIKIIKRIMYLLNDLKYTIAGAKEELAKENENIIINDNELSNENKKNENENKKNDETKKEIKKELEMILELLDDDDNK